MNVTQTEETKTSTNKKNKSRKSKILSLLLKVVGGLFLAIVLFFFVIFIVNIAGNKSDLKKIQHYGQLVPVDGKNMNVLIQGEGEETIVLLPGQGTASPVLDFKPLIDELSPYYRVVAVEPLGYGLSDKTDKERTTDNIVSEVHGALQQLEIDRFILMGHSITGIYGLDYVNKYPNEVSAFIGIDTSVPNQFDKEAKVPLNLLKFLKNSGLQRFVSAISPNPFTAFGYDDETSKQLMLFSNVNGGNDTLMNELSHLFSNFKGAQNLKFPQDMPLLLFIQANNEGIKTWIPLHEEQAKQSSIGKVIQMDGDHYLHHKFYKEIAEDFREYMNEVKEAK